MTLANVVLICHVAAALVMLASLVTEWIGVTGLRAAWTADQARRPLKAIQTSAAFGPSARLAVLGAGLWLAIVAWSWQGWIIAGLVGWTALVLLGEPLTGRNMRAMVEAARTVNGALPPDALARIHNPRLWSSLLTRTGVVIGVIAGMIGKPGLVLGLALLLAGYLLGFAAAKLTPQPARGTNHPEPAQKV